jgi:hypothetical protein
MGSRSAAVDEMSKTVAVTIGIVSVTAGAMSSECRAEALGGLSLLRGEYGVDRRCLHDRTGTIGILIRKMGQSVSKRSIRRVLSGKRLF